MRDPSRTGGSPISFGVHEGVATLTLDDAEHLNTLSSALLEAALEAVARVQADLSVRVLVLAANGKAFSAGADLAALRDLDAKLQPGAGSLGDAVAELMDTGGNRLVLALRELPVPVLCAVQGAVAGGGVGLVLAADVVVAARSAYFMLPFVPALGLVPDMGAAWFLQRAVGTARTAALTLLGDRLSAEQAAQWGLIWAAVDDDALSREAAALAARLAALPAHAAAETRHVLAAARRNDLGEQLAYERDRQRELIDGECFREGVAAFLGKRRATFPGRRPS